MRTWRACVSGHYEASDDGRVRRVSGNHRVMPNGGVSVRPPSGTALRPQLRRRDGRYYVTISVAGKRRLRGVHQLVAEAFLGPVPTGQEVNHINGDKADNRASNLEYITHRENCVHARRLGLTPRPPVRRGEQNRNSKMTEARVREMRARHTAGRSTKQLAAEFGVCTSSVDYIVRRVYWKHVA